jgi:hypothetical protein
MPPVSGNMQVGGKATMRRGNRAFTILDLAALTGLLALILSVVASTSGRARELSKRMVCSTNLKGIGAAARIYAGDNNGQWMVPAFRRALIDNGGIQYLAPADSCPPRWQGQVGYQRLYRSTSETGEQPSVGSTSVTTTRAYWMLVRSGDITFKQYVCPSSGDTEDLSENVDLYYDFTCYQNISYGYQVPFGPRDTQAHDGMDNRQIVAADKGPFYSTPYTPHWNVGAHGLVDLDDVPRAWRLFNSRNHGGLGNGEGQNALHADGHASFYRIPAVGVDNDNIYTLMLNQWDTTGYNRIHGNNPQQSGIGDPPYPGQDAFGNGPGMYASTDSLIYP